MHRQLGGFFISCFLGWDVPCLIITAVLKMVFQGALHSVQKSGGGGSCGRKHRHTGTDVSDE